MKMNALVMYTVSTLSLVIVLPVPVLRKHELHAGKP